MATFVYPTSQQITAIAQDKIPQLTLNDPIFQHFPVISQPWVSLRWEQRDNFGGLQQLRGVGGAPQRVTRYGMKAYSIEPGAFGEFVTLEEREMMERRPMGAWDGIMNIGDLVMEAQDILLDRQHNRMKWILWQLVTTGTFWVPLPVQASGGHGFGDQYNFASAAGQFGMRTASAAVDWDTFATSTPIQDFRAIKLYSRGTSSIFDRGSVAYMNQITFNKMLRCTNANDLGGKRNRTVQFATLGSVKDINAYLLEEDLPQIVIYEGGYLSEDGTTWNLFVPDDKVVVIGRRENGDPLGNYVFTRNMVNPDAAPGAYSRVLDYTNGPQQRIPPSIEIHQGHNGGPVIYYPGAITILSV